MKMKPEHVVSAAYLIFVALVLGVIVSSLTYSDAPDAEPPLIPVEPLPNSN